MKISELCIRRPVLTTLLMASIALAGLFAYGQLPIAAIPRIDVPTIRGAHRALRHVVLEIQGHRRHSPLRSPI